MPSGLYLHTRLSVAADSGCLFILFVFCIFLVRLRIDWSINRSIRKYEKWLEPEGLTLLEGWARDGLTDEQIAHNCGITVKTLYEWKNRYGEICEALKRGKEVVDLEVENALLKSALGFSYDEVMTEESPDGVKKRVTKKMVLPSVTAQIFWLKNRRPDTWRDKPPEAPDAAKENNLLDAILEGTKGVISTDDLPELQQAADADPDLVEPGSDRKL